MERERYNELERVVLNERKQQQQKDFTIEELERKQLDSESEIERQKLRIQSNHTLKFIFNL